MLKDTNDYRKLDIAKWSIVGVSILVIIVTVSLALSDDAFTRNPLSISVSGDGLLFKSRCRQF